MFEGLMVFLGSFWIVPIGVVIGMFVGGMPGLSSSGALAMMLPILLALPPEVGLMLGISLYAGAEMGNSFPAVMLNIPGTPGGAITAADGFPLMKQGLAAWALGLCIGASVVGAIIGAVMSLGLSSQIARFAIKIGPAEICIIVLFGLVVIAQVSTSGLVKGLLAGFFGLLLATTGTDPTFGQTRNTFEIVYLFDKLPVVAVLVGLLGYSEVLKYSQSNVSRLLDKDKLDDVTNIGFSGIFKGIKDCFKDRFNLIRSAFIGLGIGVVPGAGASVASFVAYQQAYGFSNDEDKKKFGKGSPKGLVAADASNNAVVGGALVPLLTLGIPGSGSTAVLLVVMTYHGLFVGPRLFELNADIAYAILWSQFFAAFSILVVGTLLAFFAYRVALLNVRYLIPIITCFCLMGGFAYNGYLFDMGLVVGFGLLGYVMKKTGYPVIALLLGAILGRIFEEEFMRAWRLGMDSPELFFDGVLACSLWVLLLLTTLGPWLYSRFGSVFFKKGYDPQLDD